VLEYLDRCGQMAAGILTGKSSPLETLFPGGSLTLAERLYEQWPLSRYYNGIARAAIESLVRTLPHGDKLRILEIGAGTGGTTSALLPILPAGRTLYWFTDVSRFFLNHAEQKFKGYPFLRFGLLDVEKAPLEQGYGEHGFDVVLAANVLHATRDLNETIQNLSKLLAFGGIALLCEATSPPSWVEFCFGLMEGWHRYNDDVRHDGLLLSPQRWEQVLTANGFEEVATFPESASPAEILGSHLLVARSGCSEEDSRIQRQIDSTTTQTISPALIPNETKSPHNLNGKQEEFYRSLEQASPSERRDQLVEFVRSRVMRILRRDPSDPIDPRGRLMDLGIDSLMAVELRNTLTSQLGLAQPLPATLIFDYPNVEAIANYLMARMFHSDKVSAQIPTQSTDKKDHFPRSRATIEGMSDVEVEDLLLKRLAAL
jgi:SAM-dependent methyltransferase/acyl carrier protein